MAKTDLTNQNIAEIVPRALNDRELMTVRIEKSESVWTVILSRQEARNAMNPKSADALQEAFLEFEKDESASVAVFWGEGGAFCAGWDLKHAASLEGDRPLGELDFPEHGNPPRGAMGPSRLELDRGRGLSLEEVSLKFCDSNYNNDFISSAHSLRSLQA